MNLKPLILAAGSVILLSSAALAQNTRPPRASTTPPQSNNSSSYPPSCVRTDCNCQDFQYQEDAQRVLNDPNYPNDKFGLDGPKGPRTAGVPGKACENRPSRGNAR